ncbi:MAG: MBL fold metallo-hydrolase [Tepidiformaceae bacterium]
MPQAFDVVFLGTGSPLPSPDRCGCGCIIVAGNTNVLVDCGYGAARRIVPAGIIPAQIDVAIFTHMHTDHITDVPDFINQRWVSGATKPLRVFGPAGTQKMITGFLMAIEDDIRFRTAHHPGKLHPQGAKVEVTEFTVSQTPEAFFAEEGLVLESFEVDHFPVVPAVGYRAKFDGRSVVLSGDTNLCDSLLNAAQGTDLLISDALNPAMFAQYIERVRSMGRSNVASILEDVPSYHINTQEVTQLARDAGVGSLVLSHLLPNLPNNDEMEAAFKAGMSDIYSGPIRLARDLQRITVEKRVNP